MAPATNSDRVAWVSVTLGAFEAIVEPGELAVDPESVLVDLLADLWHWADRNGIDWQAALRSAESHHVIEPDAVEAQKRPSRTLESCSPASSSRSSSRRSR